MKGAEPRQPDRRKRDLVPPLDRGLVEEIAIDGASSLQPGGSRPPPDCATSTPDTNAAAIAAESTSRETARADIGSSCHRAR
jgi:hypothetical protein